MDPSYIFFVEIEFNNAKKITLNLRKNDVILCCNRRGKVFPRKKTLTIMKT